MTLFENSVFTGKLYPVQTINGIRATYFLKEPLVLIQETWLDPDGKPMYGLYAQGCSLVGIGDTPENTLGNFEEEFEYCWETIVRPGPLKGEDAETYEIRRQLKGLVESVRPHRLGVEME